MTSFHQRFLGKIFQCGKYRDMSSQYLPCLDFLVSSVQFSVNNKSFIDYPTNRWFPVDAPSKLDNAKLGGQRLPITLRCARVLGTFSQTTCAPIIFALRLDSWAGQPQMPDLRL